MILIVSSLKDEHAVAVTRLLDAKGAPYLLFDTAAYPTKWQLSVEYRDGVSALSVRDLIREKDIDLTAVTTAWWRRPLPLVLDSDVRDPAAAQFTYNECLAGLSGLWQIVPALWINHPVFDEAAARKLYQLKVAAAVGLSIPRTLVTNNPDDARQFVRTIPRGQVIYKSFQATEQAWRETRLLSAEALERLDDVKYAPVIFQEYIPATADLRVTVIGQQLFCIAVSCEDQHYAYDYRMNLDAVRAEPFHLPPGLKERLLKFMRSLHLVYGAIDLRYTPDGDYCFLEINPAGQWQFLEEKTDLQITDYFTKFLMHPEYAAVS